MLDQIAGVYPTHIKARRITALRMPLDLPNLIQLLEILLLLLTQHFPPGLERFIHALHTREPDYRTRHPLVDPRKRNMAHLPVMFLGQLLNTLNNLAICFCMSGERSTSFLLTLRTGGRAKGRGRTCEIATAERRPLRCIRKRNREGRAGELLTGMSPTPVELQKRFISRSSSR